MASEFEREVLEAAKRSIVKRFREGNLLEPDYQRRAKIPDGFVRRVYESIDWDDVLARIKRDLHGRIAGQMLASMLTEMGHDVKFVLSNEKLRNELKTIIAQRLQPRQGRKDRPYGGCREVALRKSDVVFEL